MAVGLDGAQCPSIQHLQCGRSDACGSNRGNRLRGIVHRLEDPQKGCNFFRLAQQFHRNRRGNADRPLRADKEPRHIVAAGIRSLAAKLNDFAARQHYLYSGNVIHCDAIHQGMRTAGVLGDVTADGAGFLAGRIGCKVESEVRHVLGELQVHHAGLHHRALVLDVNLENAVHAREGDHDAALLRDRSATQASARSPRHHWYLDGRGQPHDLRHLLRGLGENHRTRRTLADPRVVLVQHEVFRTIEDGVASGYLPEMFHDLRKGHKEQRKCSTAGEDGYKVIQHTAL